MEKRLRLFAVTFLIGGRLFGSAAELDAAFKAAIADPNKFDEIPGLIHKGVHPNDHVNTIFNFYDLYARFIIRLLLDHGFDVNRITEDQLRSLVYNGKAKTVQLLKDLEVQFPSDVKDKLKIMLKPQPIMQHAQLQMEIKEAGRQIREEARRAEVASPMVSTESGGYRKTQTESYLGFVYNDPDPRTNFQALVKRALSDRLSDLDIWDAPLPDINPFIPLIVRQNERDRRYQATHYNVVHAHSAGPAIVNLLQSILNEKFTLLLGKPIHLRMGSSLKNIGSSSKKIETIEEFLAYGNKRFANSNWNDHELKAEMLSVNFSVFGGMRSSGESTVEYLIDGCSLFKPEQIIRSIIFDPLHLDFDLISLIDPIFKIYENKGLRHNLIQIFFRKKSDVDHRGINDYLYLSQAYGTPHKTSIDRVIYTQNPAGYLEKYITDPASLGDYLIPLEEKLSIELEKGSKMLPYEYSNVQILQGRVVFLDGIFDDALIFSDNLMSKADNDAFKSDLGAIIDEAIKRWIKTGAYKKLINDPHYSRLARLVDLYVKGEAYKRQLSVSQAQTADELVQRYKEAAASLRQQPPGTPADTSKFNLRLEQEHEKARLMLIRRYEQQWTEIKSRLDAVLQDSTVIAPGDLIRQAETVVSDLKKLQSGFSNRIEQEFDSIKAALQDRERK